MNIKDFLTERELKGEHLIGTRNWALEQAERKFKAEYEDVHDYTELYENSGTIEEGGDEKWSLKDKYNDIFWGMVQDFEDDILEYQSELYDA